MLQNPRIGTRLSLGFLLMVALILAIAGVGSIELTQMDTRTRVITDDRLVKIQLAHQIQNEVNKQARALRTALLTDDQIVTHGEIAKIKESAPIVAKAMARLQDTITTAEGKALLARVDETRGAFLAGEKDLLELIQARDLQRARSFLTERIIKPQNAYLDAVQALMDLQDRAIHQLAEEVHEEAALALSFMISCSIVAIVLGIAIGYAITRSLTGPVGRLQQVFSEVERTSNFSLRMQVSGRCATRSTTVPTA
jgi:methyl-accepting chemotaxis protein